MTPPPNAWKKDEWEPEWLTEDNIDPTIVTTATSDPILLHPQVTVPIDPTSMDFPAQASSDSTRTRARPSTWPDGSPLSLPRPPYPYGAPAPTTDSWETLVSTTPAFAVTPYPETQNTVLVSTTDSFTETDIGAPSPSPLGPHRGRPSDWDGFKKDANHVPTYAIATVVPIVLLAIIAAVTLVCLRRRKRRRTEAAAKVATQEMKMEWHDSTERASMAPPPSPPPPPPPVLSISQHYTASQDHLPPTSTPSQFQPIILGPISPSSNGAYLTGIDTSDMVSINSGPPTAVDPFSDNHSLTEPPPPYRPSSIAPPSFTSNSRQSSLRVPVSPICSHGAERSPFDDPDDAVSILSDLSFQRERFTGTYSSR